MSKRIRQRQGRDFSVFDYLRNAEAAVEGNYNMVGDGIINNVPFPDDGTQKKSVLDRLEQAKETVAEQEEMFTMIPRRPSIGSCEIICLATA